MVGGGGLCMSGGVGGMCAYSLYHKSMDSRLSTHWHYIGGGGREEEGEIID